MCHNVYIYNEISIISPLILYLDKVYQDKNTKKKKKNYFNKIQKPLASGTLGIYSNLLENIILEFLSYKK